MSLSSIGEARSTADVSHARDLRTSEEDPSSQSFAAMLAGMANDSKPTEARAAKRESKTSELGGAAQGLAPGLKDKLARVITRMRDEFGKDVSVSEGVRSQARQNALFAQGRTTPGQVVTWTKNSFHTKGLAADLLVDGGYSDAEGFAQLQKVAREEGLHTLGKMDPGHVELRNAAAAEGEFIEGLGVNAAEASSPKAGGRAAQVAEVAKVAQVANVAQVAAVAQPARVSMAQVSHSAHGRDAGGRDSQGERGSKRAPLAPAVDGNSTTSNLRAYAEMSRPDAARLGDDAPLTSAAPLTSTSATRAEQIADLQESRAPKVLSRLNISLDDGNGGRDTVRIGMRGNEVGATFDMRDAASASRVSARLGELTSTLERRGLEPQAFNVRHSSHANELDAISARATVISTGDSTPTHNADPGTRGFNRHAPDRDDYQSRRQDADERRRRSTLFSLTTEEA